jgi:hypothetical protein
MKKLSVLFVALVGVSGMMACGGSNPPNQLKATWVAVADWVFDFGDLRIYMDGALTRFDPTNFYGGGSGLSYSKAAVCQNKTTEQRVLAAIGAKPQFFVTGHSNLDHSYDAGSMAKLSGAKIYGSQSTCFEAQAMGVSDCTSVKGGSASNPLGERVDFPNGVHARVVRWNHSGNASNADLHNPLELTKPPTPDANGCFKPGVLEDFPNGGGGRGWLFVAGDSAHRFSVYFVDTGSDFDFTQPIVDNTGTYPSPKDSLTAAMQAEGLKSVDLYIGSNSLALSQLVVPIIHPKAFIPNHLGSFYVDFFQGNTSTFPAAGDAAHVAYLQSQGVNVQNPKQFMDAWTVDSTNGTVPTPNTAVKQALGFTN